VFGSFLLTSGSSCRKPDKTSVEQTISENKKVKLQGGAVWIEEEGIRTAWLGYRSFSNEMLDYMAEAKFTCNHVVTETILSPLA